VGLGWVYDPGIDEELGPVCLGWERIGFGFGLRIILGFKLGLEFGLGSDMLFGNIDVC
jgi:hypothetical protein